MLEYSCTCTTQNFSRLVIGQRLAYDSLSMHGSTLKATSEHTHETQYFDRTEIWSIVGHLLAMQEFELGFFMSRVLYMHSLHLISFPVCQKVCIKVLKRLLICIDIF